MHRSTMTARLIITVISLVLTGIALILLAGSGRTVSVFYLSYGRDPDLGVIAGPLALQALAVILLIVVALSGIWSSAGLIMIGALGVVPLVLSMFPAALIETYRVVPQEWADALVYGLPLVVSPALGAMGVVLAVVRRHPRPKGATLGVVGIVAAPILLVAGIGLLTWGIGEGTLTALQLFQLDVRFGAAFAVLAGTVLLFAGVAVTRFSTFALVLPALALLGMSALSLLLPDAVLPSLFQLPRGTSIASSSLIFYGGGTAAAFLYLTFTAVLIRVRSRALSAAPGENHHPPVQNTYPPTPNQNPPTPNQNLPTPNQYPPAQNQNQYPPAG